jgi:hypothetical protein
LTRELELASGSTAASIVSEALDIAASQQTDASLFSSTAGTASQPPGLLNGLTAITSSGAQGAAGVAQDISKLALAISSAGIATDDLVYFTDAGSAAKIEILSSPKFTERVYPSTVIPEGEVVAIQLRGFYVGFGATPVQVEVNREATLQFEGATPLAIVDSSGKVASPTTSLFQQDLIGIRVKAQMIWAMHPGCVAYLTGADW